MNILKPTINAFVNSNLLIALAAAALVEQTYVLLTGSVHFDALTLLVFSGTLHVYIAQRMVRPKQRQQYSGADLVNWLDGRKWYTYTALTLSLLTAAVCFFFINWPTRIALISLAALSMFYALPIFPWPGGFVRLRDFGMLKPFLLGLAWGITTAMLPILEMGVLFDIRSASLVLAQTLFVTALSIPFDVKDMAYDAQTMKSHTLPNRFGYDVAVLIGTIFLLIAGLAFQFSELSTVTVTLAYLVTLIFSGILFFRINEHSSELLFTGAIDGMMLLQPILVIGVYYYW